MGIIAATFAQDYLTEDEIEVIALVNEARTNPPEFAEKYLKDHTGSVAVECYNEMKNLSPRQPLQASKVLWLAAKDHVDDTGPKGTVGHYGSDGSSPWDRIARYGNWSGHAAENVSYGFSDPLGIVLQLLIDDGVPSRGHRKNILSKQSNYVAVSIGRHSVYGYMCVMDFAGDVTEK